MKIFENIKKKINLGVIRKELTEMVNIRRRRSRIFLPRFINHQEYIQVELDKVKKGEKTPRYAYCAYNYHGVVAYAGYIPLQSEEGLETGIINMLDKVAERTRRHLN